MQNKTKARCQLGNKAMKIKVANMLRGKERKNRYAKLNRDRWRSVYIYLDFIGGAEGKASACNAGDLALIPRSGRSPGEGNGNQLQSSCLENSMDGGAC